MRTAVLAVLIGRFIPNAGATGNVKTAPEGPRAPALPEALPAIREADPWRMQYFTNAPRPPGVLVPTEDIDAMAWNPDHAWIYDKLKIALSQGLEAGPHETMPQNFPVFSKPITNLKGMGVGSRVIRSASEFKRHFTPGHFWSPLHRGRHLSSDIVVVDGRPRWWRHTEGKPGRAGTFDYWTVQAAGEPGIESRVGAWIERHLRGYTGMFNVETIGGWIIEAHMRFADQWPDLYGRGWVESLVRLYEKKVWDFADDERRDGFSVVLFDPREGRYRHPPRELIDDVLKMPSVSSVQITFHPDKSLAEHAAPPGGFRLAIVNAWDLASGLKAREKLAAHFRAQRSTPVDPQALSKILDLGRKPDFEGDFTADWRALREPFFGSRRRGLPALRRLIRERGLLTVVSQPQPRDAEERRRMEFFHGGKLAFPGKRRPPHPGVALHLPGESSPVANLNGARAAVNPHLGWGYLHGALTDKLAEYRFAEAVEPGLMPESRPFAELKSADFEARRAALVEQLDALVRRPEGLSPQDEARLRPELKSLSELFFSAVDAVYPRGAFIKNYGEFMTHDNESQITSFARDSADFADRFLMRLRSRLKRGPYAGHFGDRKWQEGFLHHDTAAGFLDVLITSPERLLIQRREDLAQDGFGYDVEVRVDFIDGEPLHAINRTNTFEYLGEEQDQAARVLRRFFARAPRPFRYLSGAADLAKRADGRWTLLEFNFGNDSGTIAPRITPLGANEAKSALLGHSTPLLARFERAFQKGPAAQRRLLKSLKVKEWGYARSAEDVSLHEAAFWLRDRRLRRWRRSPTRREGEALLRDLAGVFEGLDAPGDPYLANVLLGARRYVERVLAGR